METTPVLKRKNRRMGLSLGLVAIAMLPTAYLMWVTGGLICDWAGIGINPNRPSTEVRVLPPDQTATVVVPQEEKDE